MPPINEDGRLRYWATIIASVAGLFTALLALLRPQDHSVTQASYEELSTGLKSISAQEGKNHDDIVALRGYVAGMNGEELTLPPPPSPVDAGTTLTPFVRPPSSASAAPKPSATIVFRIIDAGAPPLLHADQAKYDPPSFDKVLSDSKK